MRSSETYSRAKKLPTRLVTTQFGLPFGRLNTARRLSQKAGKPRENAKIRPPSAAVSRLPNFCCAWKSPATVSVAETTAAAPAKAPYPSVATMIGSGAKLARAAARKVARAARLNKTAVAIPAPIPRATAGPCLKRRFFIMTCCPARKAVRGQRREKSPDVPGKPRGLTAWPVIALVRGAWILEQFHPGGNIPRVEGPSRAGAKLADYVGQKPEKAGAFDGRR